MGSVPSFLLKKLYATGSLKNTATGFELAIRNTLAPGTIVGLATLRVDGTTYEIDRITAVLPDDRSVSAADVSPQSAVCFALGDKVTLQVQGQPLSAGRHKLVISPTTKEAGTLDIVAEDAIQ